MCKSRKETYVEDDSPPMRAEIPKPNAALRKALSVQLDMPPRAVQVSPDACTRGYAERLSVLMLSLIICDSYRYRSGSRTVARKQRQWPGRRQPLRILPMTLPRLELAPHPRATSETLQRSTEMKALCRVAKVLVPHTRQLMQVSVARLLS